MFANDQDTEKIVEPSTWAELAYNGFMWWASAGEQRHGDEAEEAAKDASLLADLISPPQQRRDSFGRRASCSPAARALGDSVSSPTARKMPLGDGANDDQEQDDGDEDEARVELAIIAYFHRLTTSIFGVLADMVQSAGAGADDDDGDDGDDLLDVNLARGAGGDGQGAAGREDAALLPGSAGGEWDEEDGGAGWIRVDSDAMAQMGLDVWSSADAAFVKEVAARYFARKAYVESKGVEVCGLRVC